jgi:hypothetical protein
MLLFAAQSTQHSSAQVAQEKGPPSYYTLLTPGMLAGPVFPYTFAAGKFRVKARNLIMGHAKASELRGGAVTTTINGQSQERIEGDFWIVEKGSHLDIDNRGQVAVIRAVYVYPGAK